MSTLTLPSTGLPFSTIDSFIKNAGGANYNGSNISLAGSEQNYMGSTGSSGNFSTSKVCMLGQKDAYFSQSYNPINTNPSNPFRPFNYSGPTNPWWPVRASEFIGTVAPIPIISTSKQELGVNNQGRVIVTVSSGTPPYYVFNSNANSWVATDGSFTLNVNNGYSSTFYVVDSVFCGGNFDISSLGSYP